MLEFQRVLGLIADSIRTLNETEAPLTLDEMGVIMEKAKEEAIATEECINSYNSQDSVDTQFTNEFFTGVKSVFSNNEVYEILPYTFAYQSNITKVEFQNCLSLHNSAFQFTNIIEGSFPECRYIGDEAFHEVTSLTSINAAKCIKIGNSAFEGCTSLSTVSFPVCKEIGSYAFSGCQSLSEIYLTSNNICKLYSSNAFTGTPRIYVPSSLVTSYQSASNWSYFSSYFVGI